MKKLLALILTITIIITGTAAAYADNNEAVEVIDSFIDIIKEDYYKDIDDEILIRGAIDGIFEALDPYSDYLDPEEFKEITSFTNGEFGGIGVSIEKKDGYIRVVSPIEGTPAHKAGLNTGDIIVSADDVELTEYSLEKAVTFIKGEPGTKVKLGVIKAGTADVIYIEITRAIIKVESVKKETPFGRKAEEEIKDPLIGYVRLTEFNDKTYDDFKEVIGEYKEQGKKGLIIDLRNNPGGLLRSVVEICQEIIPQGPIVHIDAKGEANDETYNSTLEEPPFKIAVIVNEGSASASEILTGAVKDSKVGVIVGTNTYGKGTVQNILYLTNGGGIKLTIAEYLTRNKINIDGKGIKPDVVVELPQSKDLAPVKMGRNISLGTVGLDVYGIQQRLNELGYKISPDGIMGKGTLEAVNEILAEQNLPQVDMLTKEAQKTILTIHEQNYINYIEDTQLQTAVAQLQELLK